MSEVPTPLLLARCDACGARFAPVDGPCPRCGSTRVGPYPVPEAGRAIAATELANPAPGWTAPHRLALVEVAEGVRLLAVVEGPLPNAGDALTVRLEGEVYRARPAPVRERGEGESPRTRRRGSSFEPPR